MASEIERKFLLRDDGWQRDAGPGVRIRQGYIVASEAASVRVRISGNQAWVNIKGATVGVSRAEFEYPVPLADAEQILEDLCIRPLIEKTRHLMDYAGHRWEIDVFEGENHGLMVAEIELDSENERFEKPPWVGEEVSMDPRYYNASLAKRPFRMWKDEAG
jgi:adenylate cyclase